MSVGTVARTLFVSSRPVSWINTAYPFAAAYLLTVREIDLVLFVGTLFFLVPYNLAMYGINDVFDYESDLRNPRKGAAHGAVLDRSLHRVTLWAAALSCAPFLVALVVASIVRGQPLAIVVLAASMFFVLAYSAPPFRWKEKPFADSVTSAMHFMTPAAFGLALGGAHVDLSLIAILVAFTLWGIASHAFGAVQDIVSDREADISSIATVMGARWTVRFALASYLAAGAAMLLTTWPGPLAAAVTLLYVATVWPYRHLSDENCGEATRGWDRFLWINQLAGFVITLLLIWWWLLSA